MSELSADFKAIAGIDANPILKSPITRMPAMQVYGAPPFLNGLDMGPPPALPTPAQQDTTLTISDQVWQRYAYMTGKFSDDPLILDKGYKTLEEQLTYSFVSSPTRLKKYTSLYKEHEIIPCVRGEVASEKVHGAVSYDKANEYADFCRYVLENIYDPETGERTSMVNVLWEVADAWHLGYSISEIEHRIFSSGPYKGKRGYARFTARNPQNIRFRLDPYSNRIMDVVNYAYTGYQSYLPLRKFFMYTYQPFRGLPFGKGDGRVNHKHVWAVSDLIRQWGLALQKHGGGFLKVIDPVGTEKHLQSVHDQMAKMSASGLIVLPKGYEVDSLGLPANVLNPFMDSIEWHCSQVASNILGQKLTTMEGTGKGTFALASIHQDTQEYFAGYCRNGLENIVTTQGFKRLIEMNYGADDVDYAPRYSLGVWSHAETAIIATYMKDFIESGILNPQEAFIRNRANLPPNMLDMPTLGNWEGCVLTPNRAQLRENEGSTSSG